MYTNDPDVVTLARKIYPAYNGKHFRVEVRENVNCASYWEGGSHTYYTFVNLINGEVIQKAPAQSAFDRPVAGIDKVQLLPNMAIVSHSFFWGKDTGITFYIHKDNAPRFLPAPMELSIDEKAVLKYTSMYKNTYAGRSNIRFEYATGSTGITQERWNQAQQTLIGKKLLNRGLSITLEGRNQVKD